MSSGKNGDVSRQGEFSFLAKYFESYPPAETTIVDVGAYGRPASNSWNLIRQGWRGILIEPTPHRAEACLREFQGDFAVVPAAISDTSGHAWLYCAAIAGHNSLNPGWEPRHTDKIRVKTFTLPEVLEDFAVATRFGVLSVDTEGHDQIVLESMMGSRWRPEIILTEQPCRKTLQDEYRVIGQTPGNLIWRLK